MQDFLEYDAWTQILLLLISRLDELSSSGWQITGFLTQFHGFVKCPELSKTRLANSTWTFCIAHFEDEGELEKFSVKYVSNKLFQ